MQDHGISAAKSTSVAAIDRTNEFWEMCCVKDRTLIQARLMRTRPLTELLKVQSRSDTSNSQHDSHVFLTEAYDIVKSITHFARLLLQIRPFYLNLGGYALDEEESLSINLDLLSVSLRGMDFRKLTDKDRDVLEVHAQTVAKSCLDRIQVLQKLSEKLKAVESKIFKPPTTSAESIWLNRSSMITHLEQLLMACTKDQMEMQERRMELKRKYTVVQRPQAAPVKAEFIISENTSTNTGMTSTGHERLISSSELMLLESENEALLQELESDLDQVKNAAQSLSAISSLQSTLSHHIQEQQETISHLHTDAYEATDMMHRASDQLKKAQEYFGSTRIWILAFFITLSFVLLFLDYYWSG